MSKDDKEDGGGSLLQFPRVFLPGSFDAPGADVSQPVEEDERPVPGAWPSMPGVSEMAPPLALTMPGIPKPDADADADADADEDGMFVPPSPEDPANPTARDALAVCMALVTAMGVAAAHGIWHRARRRSALADEARTSADKAQAKAAGVRKAGRGGKRTSLLDSPGGKKGSRAGGRSRHGGADKDHRGSHKGPKRGGSPKGPKARQDGRRKDRDGSKRRNDRKDRPGWRKRRDPDAKSPKRPDTKQPKTPKTPKGGSKKRPGKLSWKGLKRGNRKQPKGWTSGRPKGGGKGAPKRKQPKNANRPLTWKAPKRRPGPGQGKGITGRKRWAGRKNTPPKRHRKSWATRSWKRGRKWVKRWTLRRRAAAARPRTGWSWQGFHRRGGQHRAAGSARQQARRTYTGTGMPGSSGAYSPPPPPPGFGGMRPPPGASHRVWADAERVDNPARPRQERGPAALAGAPAGGWPALPAGASGSTSAGTGPTPPSAPAGPPATNRGRPVATPVPTTQYSDAELTIYDVIDADADMAEEILAGVDEARATADGCEQFYTRLETVHAKIVELRVPGLLAGWMLRLLDQTGNVRANALAIAANLPAASEAISIAGSNAAARYQHAADTTRDYGHTRPAEREYHDE